LVEAAEFLNIEINDNPKYEEFVQQILGLIERYNKKYRSQDVMFNCEMIPAENVGVKHAKWDREAGYKVDRDCYNSYFYIVEDDSLNVIDKFRLHGRKYIEHLTGGSALHLNLEEHLSKEQYAQLLRVATQEGCNYFTFNIPNTVCNKCGHIDKHKLAQCPSCNGSDLDYLTRIIGYMKRVSNFSQPRQQEAAKRHYATVSQL
jgi:ribonucleoside-triphosphate reductase